MSKLIAGAFLGLVAGILLAPDKGVNTREQLVSTADRLKTRLNKLAGRAGAELDDLREYLDQDISGLTSDVKNRILTILDEAEEMAYKPGAHISNGVL